MSDSNSTIGHLTQLGVLRFAGSAAASFLQGQISNDTRRLAESEPLFAAYSSPQGRVLALLHLLPHSSGILALLPRELVRPTLETLRRFVLRAKVTIDDASDLLWVAGRQPRRALRPDADGATYVDLHPPAGDHLPARAYREEEGVGRAPVATAGSASTDAAEREWLVGSPDVLRQHGWVDHAIDPHDFENEWRLADIRAGVPQIYLATREAFVAQMLNLDRLDGISFSKGCYTGQEIIARTQHLGRIKRRLYRLRLPAGDWDVGRTIRLTDGRAGRLVEVARVSADAVEALAVLNVEVAAVSSGGTITDGGMVSAVVAGSAGSARSDVNDNAASANVPVDAVQLTLPYSL